MAWIGLYFLLGLTTAEALVTNLTLRVVTWNVNDNEKMKGEINDGFLHELLFGKSKYTSSDDVYAITLQENKFKFTESESQYYSKFILNQLNHYNPASPYVYVGHNMTKSDGKKTKFRDINTVNMFVFARKNVGLTQVTSFRTNECKDGGWLDKHTKIYRNPEKGIAAVKAQFPGGAKLCVAGLHLSSRDPEQRRECFDKFLSEQAPKLGDCSITVYAGDFNTRTVDKNPYNYKVRHLSGSQREILFQTDEMRGRQPFGGKKLIEYISAQNKQYLNLDVEDFRESKPDGPLTFFPTYSLLPSEECENLQDWRKDKPCYRGDRPRSWTDRIIFNFNLDPARPAESITNVQVLNYFSVPTELSDHHPVISRFQLQ